MYDFEKSKTKQHASNVYNSFVQSIKEQFIIFSENQEADNYSFSTSKDYFYGWNVSIIDDAERVIVRAQALPLDALAKVIKMTPARKKSLTTLHPTKFSRDEFDAMKTSMATLVAKKYGFKKDEIAISSGLYAHESCGFMFTINITEMTSSKLNFISDLLKASNFLPCPSKTNHYAMI